MEPNSNRQKEATAYDPSLTSTSPEDLELWLKSEITDDLSRVPGVGFDTNQERLKEGTNQEEGMKSISSTFQLLGSYLFLREKGMDNVANAEAFNQYLSKKGITSHRNCITQAVAEKINVLIPGTYKASDYSE